MWNKKSNNDRVIYEYTMYSKYGYLNYIDYTTFLKNKYQEIYGDGYANEKDFTTDKAAIQKEGWKENESVKEFIDKYGKQGFKLRYLEPIKYKSGKTKPGGTGYLIAIEEKSVVWRLVDYIKGFITFENKNMVQDPELTERYVRFEKDPYSGMFAIVGSGTQHKYLLYFDGRFPFIHQNWMHLNLGTSFTRYRGQEITTVISTPVSGELKTVRTQYPTKLGTDEYVETAINFHSLTYNNGILSDVEKEQFPDKYTVYTYNRSGMSMLETSFVIGIIASMIAYAIGLPLGFLNARKKDKLPEVVVHAGKAAVLHLDRLHAEEHVRREDDAPVVLFDLQVVVDRFALVAQVLLPEGEGGAAPEDQAEEEEDPAA